MVLVTGGTSYVANYVIRELLRQNFTVRTTVRNLKTNKRLDILKNGCNVKGAKI